MDGRHHLVGMSLLLRSFLHVAADAEALTLT